MDFTIFVKWIFIIPLFLIPAMALGGCYRHPLHYFSSYEAIRLAFTTTISWLLAFLLLIGLYRNISIYLAPMAIFVLLPTLALPRVLWRIKWDKKQVKKNNWGTRIIIYGAGRAGLAITNWIGNGNVIGFLDDDPNLKGKIIAGKRVLGHESDISTTMKVYSFDELWLTFQPSVPKRSRLQETCESQNIELRFLSDIKTFSRFFKPED